MNIGYACINLSLGKKITTNRTMVKRTFIAKGVDYVSDLVLQNVADLEKIIDWNEEMGIKMYRMSSEMFPWATEYEFTDLKDWNEIQKILQRCGAKATMYKQRLSFHPGPFNVLVSPKENVVLNTIKDLEVHGRIMDAMELSKTPYNKINIHCNGVYGDKIAAMDRFVTNFDKLSNSVKSRLTIENDDKASMYSVKDLMYIHNKINIPIVFDYHHHTFNTGDLSEQQALELAMSTWPKNIIPAVHYSESAIGKKPQAHSDYIQRIPETYDNKVDIMVEAKQKDLAIIPFLNKQKSIDAAELLYNIVKKEVDELNKEL
jgi:UV DNA damage endonuclease